MKKLVLLFTTLIISSLAYALPGDVPNNQQLDSTANSGVASLVWGDEDGQALADHSFNLYQNQEKTISLFLAPSNALEYGETMHIGLLASDKLKLSRTSCEFTHTINKCILKLTSTTMPGSFKITVKPDPDFDTRQSILTTNVISAYPLKITQATTYNYDIWSCGKCQKVSTAGTITAVGGYTIPWDAKLEVIIGKQKYTVSPQRISNTSMTWSINDKIIYRTPNPDDYPLPDLDPKMLSIVVNLYNGQGAVLNSITKSLPYH